MPPKVDSKDGVEKKDGVLSRMLKATGIRRTLPTPPTAKTSERQRPPASQKTQRPPEETQRPPAPKETQRSPEEMGAAAATTIGARISMRNIDDGHIADDSGVGGVAQCIDDYTVVVDPAGSAFSGAGNNKPSLGGGAASGAIYKIIGEDARPRFRVGAPDNIVGKGDHVIDLKTRYVKTLYTGSACFNQYLSDKKGLHIIHAVGPKINSPVTVESREAFRADLKYTIHSIVESWRNSTQREKNLAIPLISSGIFMNVTDEERAQIQYYPCFIEALEECNLTEAEVERVKIVPYKHIEFDALREAVLQRERGSAEASHNPSAASAKPEEMRPPAPILGEGVADLATPAATSSPMLSPQPSSLRAAVLSGPAPAPTQSLR